MRRGGQRRGSHALPLRRLAFACQLGQTEVQNLGLATLGEENVRRFDVPMDDAFGVSGIRAVGDLDGQVQHIVGLEQARAGTGAASASCPPDAP